MYLSFQEWWHGLYVRSTGFQRLLCKPTALPCRSVRLNLKVRLNAGVSPQLPAIPPRPRLAVNCGKYVFSDMSPRGVLPRVLLPPMLGFPRTTPPHCGDSRRPDVDGKIKKISEVNVCIGDGGYRGTVNRKEAPALLMRERGSETTRGLVDEFHPLIQPSISPPVRLAVNEGKYVFSADRPALIVMARRPAPRTTGAEPLRGLANEEDHLMLGDLRENTRSE